MRHSEVIGVWSDRSVAQLKRGGVALFLWEVGSGSSKVDGVLMLERGGCRAPFLSPSRPSCPLGSGALREVQSMARPRFLYLMW